MIKQILYNNMYNIIYNVIQYFILKQFDTKWKKLLEFVILLQFISFYVLQYKNYIYYTFFVMLSSVVTMFYFFMNYKFDRSPSHTFLIYLLIVCSILTFVASSLSKFYRSENNLNEAPQGEKGDDGTKGHDGKVAKLLVDTKLCVEQMRESSNDEIIKYLKETKMNKEGDTFFNNLYMKRQYKKICDSIQVKNLKKKEGNYNTLVKLKTAAKKWTRTILDYKQGYNFLNNHFYIDKKWDTLLSQDLSLNEKVSPFTIIKSDKIWKWSL